jgi:hypothetical protein
MTVAKARHPTYVDHGYGRHAFLGMPISFPSCGLTTAGNDADIGGQHAGMCPPFSASLFAVPVTSLFPPEVWGAPAGSDSCRIIYSVACGWSSSWHRSGRHHIHGDRASTPDGSEWTRLRFDEVEGGAGACVLPAVEGLRTTRLRKDVDEVDAQRSQGESDHDR